MTSPLPTPLVWTCQGDPVCGFLHLPKEKAKLVVVMVAGGAQTRVGAHRMFIALAMKLASAGYAVLRFDMRGRGDSGGNYPGFENLGDDIASAVTAATVAQPSIAKVAVLGHCDGATACCFAKANGLDAAGLILLNPWIRTAQTQAASERLQDRKNITDPDKWRRLFAGKISFSSALKSLMAALLPRQMPVESEHDLLTAWRKSWAALKCPTLVITGGHDGSGQEFRTALATFSSHRALTEKLIVEGDHSFSTQIQMDELTEAIAAWLKLINKN
jgi:uncharacterized protein